MNKEQKYDKIAEILDSEYLDEGEKMRRIQDVRCE